MSYRSKIIFRRAAAYLLTLGGGLASIIAHAQFALAISPPRFELEAEPGEVVRQTVSLTNGGALPASFAVSTADWSLAADGNVSFSEPLVENSCRPWVAIERRNVILAPGGEYRFRFEVAPPAATTPRECRFAIVIEGQADAAAAGDVKIPVAARVAVIVYLGVGGVRPELRVVDVATQLVNGKTTPVLLVRNDGSAHGRVGGFLTGEDASGTSLEFSPSDTPILPGGTRAIALLPARAGDPEAQVELRFPVTVKGQLELGGHLSKPVDLRFGP